MEAGIFEIVINYLHSIFGIKKQIEDIIYEQQFSRKNELTTLWEKLCVDNFKCVFFYNACWTLCFESPIYSFNFCLSKASHSTQRL